MEVWVNLSLRLNVLEHPLHIWPRHSVFIKETHMNLAITFLLLPSPLLLALIPLPFIESAILAGESSIAYSFRAIGVRLYRDIDHP